MVCAFLMNEIHEKYFLPQGLPFESVKLKMSTRSVTIIAAALAAVVILIILILNIIILSVIMGTQNGK